MRSQTLFFEAHERLEEVVKQPQAVVELVEHASVFNGIQAEITQIGAHEGMIVLLDKAVIVLVKRARAGELNGLGAPEVQLEVVEEFFAIIGMGFEDRKGQAGLDTREAIPDHQTTATENGHAFAPTGGDIRHLQGMHVLPAGGDATVMDQIGLPGQTARTGEVTWVGLIEGNALDGNLTQPCPRRFGHAAAK
jgi:hypothetical protein